MKIINRRATFDYQIAEKLEAGIQLYGFEVKSVREGKADLTGSFVKIIGNEAFLINAKIFPYKYARPEKYDENRTRKLLLHRNEITALASKMKGQNLALVPMSIYTTKEFIKVELGLGKGKKQYDKRASIKKKELKRSAQQAFGE